MIDLAIIIVAYKSAGDLPALLESVPRAVGELEWHAIVVDNYGLDDLSAVAGADPRVTVMQTGANLGYSGGLNHGLQHAPESRYTVFLNPDLTLHENALSALVSACRPGSLGDVAAAVPVVLDETGAVQPSLRREPTVRRSLGEALFGDRWAARPAWLAEMVRDPAVYHAPAPVEWATGAALVVRSDALAAVGPWDSQRFFLYSEETDYSRRIRACGHVIVFVPDAVVSHRGAGSGSSSALEALMAVNKLRYFRKWHGPAASAAFFCVAVLHNLLRANRPHSRAILTALLVAPSRTNLPGGVT